MEAIEHIIKKNYSSLPILSATFGLEKESQRITYDGKLAKTDHPNVFGNRTFHPTIQTDFSETQIEMITPVADSITDVMEDLAAIHDVVLRSLPDNEALWPLSMPPDLPVKESDIMIAKLETESDVQYREYLAKAYGKRKQMVSGIHYNFEFSEDLLKQLFAMQTEETDFQLFRTNLYMKVTQYFMRYRWLLTYLLGASPQAAAHYFDKSEDIPKHFVRSIRSSALGYVNHPDVKVSFASLQSYVKDIYAAVEEGYLSEEKEFYAAVRLRGGQRVEDLAESGIRYIEIRSLDLDPFTEFGIKKDTVCFIQLLLLYFLGLPAIPENQVDDYVEKGKRLNEQVAMEKPLDRTVAFEEGMQLLKNIKQMTNDYHLEEAVDCVDKMIRCLEDPALTIAGRMVQQLEQQNMLAWATKKALANKQAAFEKPYALRGFTDLELSTQLLLFDAIQKGLHYEILDRHDQFLALKFGEHLEYVKNANMTSLDTYIAPLIMENKVVTKKVLGHAGFYVPKGNEYQSKAAAIRDFGRYADKGIVIKPKSTNYGLGISIFKEGTTLTDYETALDIAFKEDVDVLVEEFIEGTEYRFFVINDRTEAIMLRVPANVVGDGKHTIRELVIQKNDNIFRGEDHRAPLEKIQLGEIEALMLKEQGYDFESILTTGQQVFLRENSNISTGGDSIDMTDEVDESYKELAVAMSKTIGAKICGVDLIIPDAKRPVDSKEASYAVIEANFNPAMHMHAFVVKGQGRRLTLAVLKALFPEMDW